MNLQEKIDEVLALRKGNNYFLQCFSLNYSDSKKVLAVSYCSIYGLYDIYDIKEGMNQREETNHVKYKYSNKTLTILVDEEYLWRASSTTSTDILRLPNDVQDIKLEFFNHKE
ncbi:hypothetical protein HY837_01360 [archaeon]|nr:hypothetical protein [archaeon]